MHSVESVHTCARLFLLKLHAGMYNTQQAVYQWCNVTLARRFWATKMCLWASKISKIRLIGRATGQVTSWKVNFENYSRYLLIKWYQFLSVNTALAIDFFIILTSFTSFPILFQYLYGKIFFSAVSQPQFLTILYCFKKIQHGCPYKGCSY